MTYYNEELVAQWSDAALATNDPLLTPFRLTGNWKDHCAALLDHVNGLPISKVLDVGGGMGALGLAWKDDVEQGWQSIDHIEVDLLNISQAQLDRAIGDPVKIHANFLEYKGVPETYDGVVFQSVIGHLNPILALKQADALLKPNGWVMIVDMHPEPYEAHQIMKSTLRYDVWSLSEWIDFIHNQGMCVVRYHQYNTNYPAKLFASDLGEAYNTIKAAVCPFIMVAQKKG